MPRTRAILAMLPAAAASPHGYAQTLKVPSVLTLNGARDWVRVVVELVPILPISGLLSAPIAVFEMLLAGWLVVKGFGSPATASEPAGTVTNKLLVAA
jgi:hypothetical protein